MITYMVESWSCWKPFQGSVEGRKDVPVCMYIHFQWGQRVFILTVEFGDHTGAVGVDFKF